MKFFFRLCRNADPAAGGGGVTPPGTPPVTTPTSTEFNPSSLSSLEGDKFLSIFPEEIRGKGYMKDVKNFDAFVKKFDGAQSLLGEREVPIAQDPQEKWDKFFEKIGRPKTHLEYKFDNFEGVADELKALTQAEPLLQGLWKSGLSNTMANKVMHSVLSFFTQAEAAESEKEDKAFNSFMDATFGQERKTVESNAKAFLAANIDPKLKEHFDHLDDKSYAILISAVNGIVNKYAGQDTFRKGEAGAIAPANTKDSLVARMRDIIANPAYSDPFKNKNEHRALKLEMENIREKLNTIK